MIAIRTRVATDNAQLAAIWQRSVRATHHFLTEEDIDGQGNPFPLLHMLLAAR